METTKRLTILLILAILATYPIHAAEQSKEKLSNTLTALSLVKVTCDPIVLPLSFETIDYLLHTSDVGGKAAREILDISPDHVHDLFTIDYVHEFTSKAAPKSSRGRSSGTEDGMDEYEYAMMEEEYGLETNRTRSTSSTRSSRGRGSSSRTRTTRQTPRTITTSTFATDEKSYLFSLHIQLPEGTNPAAEEFMVALLHHLQNALTGTFDAHMQKLKSQVQLADQEAHRVEAELSQKQKELRTLSGSRILDRNRILTDIEDLYNDIHKTQMDQASDKVLVDAITNQIAEIQAKMPKEINKDTVARELSELLALQQQNFQNAEKLYKSGRASAADLANAREKLARSRIELAQRREQLSKSAGGDQIESLNADLAAYSTNITQSKVRLNNLADQLAEAEKSLIKADSYETLSLKVDIAKQNLQETILWRDRMSRQIRMIQPPTVTVIGGD